MAWPWFRWLLINFTFSQKMIFKNLIIAAFLAVNSLEAADALNKKQKKSDSHSYKTNGDNSYEIPEQFVSEEYTRRSFKATRLGPYQVVYMPKKMDTVPESEYFKKKTASQELDKKESKKKGKKGEDVKNAYFNNYVESQSETSSVPDEAPRIRATVTENNAGFSDFISGRRTKLILHLPNRLGEYDVPKIDDKTDVLSAHVRHSNFYTSHHTEFDGFMTAANKEEDTHLWRNESIHPQRTYVRNNEVDPSVPHYEVDVETSQKEMESHFGRCVGRDNKKKLCPNRNSFSSVNDGCTIC